MSSGIPVPTTQKVSNMSMKNLVGKKQSKMVKFMDTDIEITKLSVARTLSVQEKARELESAGDEMSGLRLLTEVIRAGVADAAELTEEDFLSFPMDELSKLSNAIMEFSGVRNEGN